MRYKIGGRKQPKTFSIDYRVTSDFLDICNKRGKSPNHTIERLMRAFIQNYEKADIKFINCEKCKAEYSELLNECPACKKEREAKKIESILEAEIEGDKQ